MLLVFAAQVDFIGRWTTREEEGRRQRSEK